MEPSELVWRIRPGHITRDCVEELNAVTERLLGERMWARSSDLRPGGAPAQIPDHVTVEISDLVPVDQIVVAAERPGALVWLVRRGHITQRCVDEVNAENATLFREGLWRQHWGDDSPE